MNVSDLEAAQVIADGLAASHWPDGEPRIRMAAVHRMTVATDVLAALAAAGLRVVPAEAAE